MKRATYSYRPHPGAKFRASVINNPTPDDVAALIERARRFIARDADKRVRIVVDGAAVWDSANDQTPMPNPPTVALDTAHAFPAIVGRPGRGRPPYHPSLAALNGRRVSGVYAILEADGTVLYVGESHTGRLYDTITRHFRQWNVDPARDAQGRARGGTTYDRRRVRIAYAETPADQAQAIQYAAIQALRPRDNVNDGAAAFDVDLPV